jgi:imidazolonepropionase-like amidohydrolase
VPTLFIFDWVATRGADAGVFAEGVEAGKRLLEQQLRLVAAAQRAGVNVAVGTDNNGVFGLHSSVRELALLAHAGLSNQEVLAAATRNAAAACGLGDQVGTLAPGMHADILVVAADPLADVTALCDRGVVRHVVHSAAPTTLRKSEVR